MTSNGGTLTPTERLPLLAETVVSLDVETGDNVDLVQFLTNIFVVEASKGYIDVDLLRIGSLKGVASFSYETVDGTAVAGKQYNANAGFIEIPSGQDSARIRIDILDTTRWNPTTEFKVKLFNPTGCKVDEQKTSKATRVIVIDRTPFPTRSFGGEVDHGEDKAISKIGEFRLFKGFLRLMFAEDGIAYRTVLAIVYDLLKNVYHYVKLILSIYMVDTLLNFDSQENLIVPYNRRGTALVVACLFLGPPIFFFLCDFVVLRMDIQGRLESVLARQLFAKFMNYGLVSRSIVMPSEMVLALSVDIPEVVKKGYMACLRLIYLSSKALVSFYFVYNQNPNVWWAIVLVPVLMLVWARVRESRFVHASQSTSAVEKDVANMTIEIMNKMPLIASYGKRSLMNELYAGKIEKLRDVRLFEHVITKTNMFIPKLFGPGLVAFYIAFAVPLVADKQLELGVFLGTLNVFRDICDDFSEIFSTLMTIVSTFDNVVGLTVIFNKDTDMDDRLRSFEERRQITLDMKRATQPLEGQGVHWVDQLDIEIKDMSFSYGLETQLFASLNFKCMQGKIISIETHSRAGAKTFMDLLAHRIFPTNGMIYIPSHLKIVYVTCAVINLNLSVWQNVVFGNQKADPHRVEKILNFFGMQKIIDLCRNEMLARQSEYDAEQADEMTVKRRKQVSSLDLLDTNADVTVDDIIQVQEMSHSEGIMVGIIRALVSNPEVLVMHRPFLPFHEGPQTVRILDALVDSRENRGLKMPAESKGMRRPRTAFFSSESPAIRARADVCWSFPNELGGECKSYIPNSEMRQQSSNHFNAAVLENAVERMIAWEASLGSPRPEKTSNSN